MSTITFDTQELARELRTAGMPQEQAEAVVRAVVHSHTALVSAPHLDAKLFELKVDLVKWIVGLILGQTALLLSVLPRISGH